MIIILNMANKKLMVITIIILYCGLCEKPDAIWTEFVSVNGLHSKQGFPRLLIDLAYSNMERPIIAQLFGDDPSKFQDIAAIVQELGFDGLDINMGCPEGSVTKKQGAGAALILRPEKAKAIVRACQQGAPNLPISVKTRIGYDEITLDKWIPQLLETEPALITVHGRTKKQMSLVPACWKSIAKAVDIARSSGSKTLIFGNGDVKSVQEAKERAHESGVDGVMIGRGIFGKPWLFDFDNSGKDNFASDPPIPERLKMMMEYATMFEVLVLMLNYQLCN